MLFLISLIHILNRKTFHLENAGTGNAAFFGFNWNGKITETNLSSWESLIKQLNVSG